MRRSPRIIPASDCELPIVSADGALAFVVQRAKGGVYVERVQPLAGIGQLSHIMRFDDLQSFLSAYESDDMRFSYPIVYGRLRRAVEKSLGCDT